MKSSQFTITINAPASKVWSTLFDDATYREWTAIFSEGSKAVTDWQKGSKAYFTDEKGSGIVATIAESKPNEFLSIKHQGLVNDGVEDYDSEDSKNWAGATENYTLKPTGKGIELVIDLSGDRIPEGFLDYMSKTWPQALNKVKELAEKN